jgi:hypothetical protein
MRDFFAKHFAGLKTRFSIRIDSMFFSMTAETSLSVQAAGKQIASEGALYFAFVPRRRGVDART